MNIYCNTLLFLGISHEEFFLIISSSVTNLFDQASMGYTYYDTSVTNKLSLMDPLAYLKCFFLGLFYFYCRIYFYCRFYATVDKIINV